MSFKLRRVTVSKPSPEERQIRFKLIFQICLDQFVQFEYDLVSTYEEGQSFTIPLIPIMMQFL